MDSATKTALRDAMTPEQWAASRTGDVKHGPWSRQDYLLARLIDSIEQLRWEQRGNPEAPQPDPYPRPGTSEVYVQKPLSPKVVALAAQIEAAQGAHPKVG